MSEQKEKLQQDQSLEDLIKQEKKKRGNVISNKDRPRNRKVGQRGIRRNRPVSKQVKPDLCVKYGAVESCHIDIDHRGMSKESATIKYRDHQSAMKAIDELNRAELDGRTITVEYKPLGNPNLRRIPPPPQISISQPLAIRRRGGFKLGGRRFRQRGRDGFRGRNGNGRRNRRFFNN